MQPVTHLFDRLNKVMPTRYVVQIYFPICDKKLCDLYNKRRIRSLQQVIIATLLP